MIWGHHPPGNDPDAVRAAAADLIGRGYAVCALDPAAKKPTYLEWPIRPLRPEDFRSGEGIGIMAGPRSGATGHALVFIDLDSLRAVTLADTYLPPTAMTEGRAGKPRSHRGYMVPLGSIPADQVSAAPMAGSAARERYGHPGPRIRHYAGLLDIIGTGGQVACPPTLHSSGERREWHGGVPGMPGVVGYPDLLRGVGDLLTACGYVATAKATTVVATAFAEASIENAAVARDPVGESAITLPDRPLLHRVRLYLDALPAAVAGQGGHGRTYAAACALVWGFALPPEAALELLVTHYNPRCRPAWSRRDLDHKVLCAAAASDHLKPRGWLLHPRRHAQNPTVLTTPWTTA